MKMKINKQFFKENSKKNRINYFLLNLYTVTCLIIILLIGVYFHLIPFLFFINDFYENLIDFLISIILFLITIEEWLIKWLFLIENIEPIVFKNITIHINKFILFILNVLLDLCKYVLFYTSIFTYVLVKVNPNLLLNDIIFLIAEFKTTINTYLIATQDFIYWLYVWCFDYIMDLIKNSSNNTPLLWWLIKKIIYIKYVLYPIFYYTVIYYIGQLSDTVIYYIEQLYLIYQLSLKEMLYFIEQINLKYPILGLYLKKLYLFIIKIIKIIKKIFNP